jgi:hypothetical protein
VCQVLRWISESSGCARINADASPDMKVADRGSGDVYATGSLPGASTCRTLPLGWTLAPDCTARVWDCQLVPCMKTEVIVCLSCAGHAARPCCVEKPSLLHSLLGLRHNYICTVPTVLKRPLCKLPFRVGCSTYELHRCGAEAAAADTTCSVCAKLLQTGYTMGTCIGRSSSYHSLSSQHAAQVQAMLCGSRAVHMCGIMAPG